VAGEAIDLWVSMISIGYQYSRGGNNFPAISFHDLSCCIVIGVSLFKLVVLVTTSKNHPRTRCCIHSKLPKRSVFGLFICCSRLYSKLKNLQCFPPSGLSLGCLCLDNTSFTILFPISLPLYEANTTMFYLLELNSGSQGLLSLSLRPAWVGRVYPMIQGSIFIPFLHPPKESIFKDCKLILR
jgi:hypothetical protein